MWNGFRKDVVAPHRLSCRPGAPQRSCQGLSICTYFRGRLQLHGGQSNSQSKAMLLQPGVLVCLSTRPDATYQVVNVDDSSDCVWVRSFPLRERRLPTFGVPASQVRPIASERGR